MHRFRSSSAAFAVLAALLLAPCAARGAQTAPAAVITVTMTHVTGSEAVALAGTAPANAPLEIALYARFSRDLPDVLLSRRPASADAAGRYAAVVPTASAYFRGAVVTAVVSTLAPAVPARATVLVIAPNVPAPPDDIPASVR